MNYFIVQPMSIFKETGEQFRGQKADGLKVQIWLRRDSGHTNNPGANMRSKGQFSGNDSAKIVSRISGASTV